jgi:uncharacterized protein YcfL
MPPLRGSDARPENEVFVMKRLISSLPIVLLAALMLAGCGSSEPAPTGATREEAVEMHRETANREMQDIQRSRSGEAADQ